MNLRNLIPGMLAVVALGGPAWAADGSAYIVTRTDLVPHQSLHLRHVPIKGFTQIGYPHRDAVGLVHRPVRVPDATVDKAVSETPALPHLVRIQYGGTTILVDPEVDYLKKRPGGLDEGHSIVRAQRAWKAAHGAALPARTIRGAAAEAGDETAALPTPRAILLKPNVLDKHPLPTPDNMPLIPRPQKQEKDAQQVAMAD